MSPRGSVRGPTPFPGTHPAAAATSRAVADEEATAQATRAQHPRRELGNPASRSAALSGSCGRAGTAAAADSESETKLSSRLGPRPAAAPAAAVLTSGLHEDERAAPGGGGSLSPQGRGPSFRARAARPLPAAAVAAARRGHQLLPVTWRGRGRERARERKAAGASGGQAGMRENSDLGKPGTEGNAGLGER